MLRTLINKLNLSGRICNQIDYNVSGSSLSVQSVRFTRMRKPIELGTAKSKLFKIPERKRQDSEEHAELKRLNAVYKTQLRSIRQYFLEEKKKREEELLSKPQSIKDDLEFERILKINDEWNKNVAKQREIRLANERIERHGIIRLRIERQKEYDAEERRRSNEIVAKEKEAAKSFILPSNFDAALEHALANPSDFNFAIDTAHNIYPGRTSKEKLIKEEEEDTKEKIE